MSTQSTSKNSQHHSDQQWLSTVVGLRSELKFDTRSNNGQSFVVIEDPVRSKFFQVGTAEYEFLAALDGQRTVAEAIEVNHTRSQANPGQSITTEQAIKICQWLLQTNLVQSDSLDTSRRLTQQVEAIRKNKRLGWLNLISFKVRLFNPDLLLTKVLPWTNCFFSKTAAAIWTMVAVYALSVVLFNWNELSNASIGILSGTSWIYLLGSWLVLKVVHEIAHGVACKRYGGEVPEAGFLLLLFTPMAFVNVTSMWRFSDRWQRIIVAAAGMYVELFLAFIAVIVWANSSGLTQELAYQIFLMGSATTILFNANPLMRFDGYFILSDILQIPNLYAKSNRWFGDRLKHYFWGTPKSPDLFPASEGAVVRCYGLFAYFWKLSISLGLIITASVLFHGLGIVISIAGVILFFALPMIRQVKLHFAATSSSPANRRTVLCSSLATLMVVAAAFWVFKAPATKSAPAVVQFADETVVRVGADGFIQKILVASGQEVHQGQVLAELVNESLLLDVEKLKAEIRSSEIQVRIHRQQNEQSDCQIEEDRLAGLRSQLAERQDEVAALQVRSPIAGIIFQRNLEQSLGRYARRGDKLLTVAGRSTKEILVSIDQRDLESFQDPSRQLVKVLLPGQPVFQSTVTTVNPRASEIICDASLAADRGGTLPVKPAPEDQRYDDGQMILLSPRFTIKVAVDSANGRHLHAGQRGQIFFQAKTQSLGSYLFLAVSDWLKSKIEIAKSTAVAWAPPAGTKH